MAERFQALEQYPELDRELLDRLRAWIESAPDPALFRVNLVPWSAEWDVPLSKAILHFLHLTRHGVMELSLDVHCPHCNVVLNRASTLKAAQSRHYCQYCLKDVESKFDDNFEVTFTISGSLRTVKGYVGYEPSSNVEIYLRSKVEPGATTELRVEPPAHARLLRLVSWPPVHVHVAPVEPAGPKDQDLILPDELPEGITGVAEGTFTLRVRNTSRVARSLMIENHEMREYEPHEVKPRLSGLQVAIHPAFEKLFGGDTLSERESLRIRDITAAFTDIQGSTAFYEKWGDVRAYNIVRDHFEILFAEIESRDGVVVKTMGDAVMAAFIHASDAVGALLAIQGAMMRFNRDRKMEDGIFIKSGLHRGSAILVSLNGRNDYFGTTINETSRIQKLSEANKIVMSDPVYQSAGVKNILEQARVESFETRLAGLEKKYTLHRVSA